MTEPKVPEPGKRRLVASQDERPIPQRAKMQECVVQHKSSFISIIKTIIANGHDFRGIEQGIALVERAEKLYASQDDQATFVSIYLSVQTFAGVDIADCVIDEIAFNCVCPTEECYHELCSNKIIIPPDLPARFRDDRDYLNPGQGKHFLRFDESYFYCADCMQLIENCEGCDTPKVVSPETTVACSCCGITIKKCRKCSEELWCAPSGQNLYACAECKNLCCFDCRKFCIDCDNGEICAACFDENCRTGKHKIAECDCCGIFMSGQHKSCPPYNVVHCRAYDAVFVACPGEGGFLGRNCDQALCLHCNSSSTQKATCGRCKRQEVVFCCEKHIKKKRNIVCSFCPTVPLFPSQTT